MSKRRFGITILLLCFCLCMLPCQAMAASTTEAKEPIAVDRACDLTIGYRYEGTAVSYQSVNLYKVAGVSADFQYTLASAFAAYELNVNGIQTTDEWNQIRSTLEARTLADKTAPTATAQTDADGQACFTGLTPGLYLASAVETVQEDNTYLFDSMLIALPGLGTDGLWQYGVTVAAKPQALPPVEPDEEIELNVVKLWKGDEGRSDRPVNVEVEIFRDGTLYETVTLSAENNWSYSWSAMDDGADWNVVEKKVPSGYVMTVEQRSTTFVITNTRPDQPPSQPPSTGDTANVLLYVVLMLVSGAMLVVLAMAGKRKRHEEID